MNKKTLGECLSIKDLDDGVRMQKVVAWQMASAKRLEHIEELCEQGLKGKKYSDAVVAYDKENMNVFNH